MAVQPHGEMVIDKLKGASVIDAHGQYAIPGLWDMHTHLTFHPSLNDRISTFHIANGITSVRDLGGVLDDVLAFRRQAQQPHAVAPYIWLAGPLLDGSPPMFDGSPESHGPAMSLAVDTPEEAVRQVDALVDHGINVIKPYSMLRPEVFSAIVKRAHQRGLKVAGHIPYRMTVRQAVEAGIDNIEHLSNINFDCAHNAQGLIDERIAILAAPHKNVHAAKRALYPVFYKSLANQDQAQCDALIRTLVDKNIWVTPTIHTGTFRMRRLYEPYWLDESRYLPEPLRTQWKKRWVNLKVPLKATQDKPFDINTYGKWAEQTVKQMHAAGVKFLAGSDPVGIRLPGFSLHDELRALVLAGVTPLAALQAATLHPAQFFEVDNQQGSIAVGNVADIVLLDADPLADISNTRKINTVILRGKVLDRKTLDGLLAELSEE